MNLGTLRERLKNSMDYSPELRAFNNQIDSIINDAYMNIWTLRRWNFSTKNHTLKFIPDILPTRDTGRTAGATVTAALNKGSREVSFSGLMDRLTAQNFEGAIFSVEGHEYTISKVVSAQNILLDKPYIGTTAAENSSWEIKKRYYSLPEDCTELLSLSHKDTPATSNGGGLPARGKLVAIAPRKDEELNLRVDLKASYAEAYVWSPPENIAPGETLGLSSLDKNDTTGFQYDTYLEVCWAFKKNGKIGALSEPQTIKFTPAQEGGLSASLVIDFLSWDGQPIIADTFNSKDTMPTQYEGYTKVIFWNSNFNRTTGERLGLPAWKHFNNGGVNRNSTNYLLPITVADTSSQVVVGFLNSIDSGNARYIEVDGLHLRIRPYPRVDSWNIAVEHLNSGASYSEVGQDFLREAEMRYLYKPPSLAQVTDTPAMHSEFHDLIVKQALVEMYTKCGNVSLAEVYRSRVSEGIKSLERRYIDHIETNNVRGMFSFNNGLHMGCYDPQSLRKLS